MRKLTLGIVAMAMFILVGCSQQVNNPNQSTIIDNSIEATSPTESTIVPTEKSAAEVLSDLADQGFSIKGDQISEADFDSIVTFGQAFVNLYAGAVAEQEIVSFENYISNANLLTFTNKMLELEQKLDSNGVLGVNFGLDNEFEEEEFKKLNENLYALYLPFSYQGSGRSCTLLVQSANQSLEIVDFYFGYKDAVDTITTGHPAVRKINNPKIWDDQEWVDGVFDKLEQYESELNS